ncbi:MAG: rRNA cytosine-C5-methyltransferase [Bacteroidaceae bacterium]|nr:rRNA cytosine-C5-methyltransferase [Bacteroidaceae bacterium]
MQLPDSFIEQMRSSFSEEELQQFVDAIGSTPITSIRINGDKMPETALDEFNLQNPVLWASNAYYLNERPSFTFDPLFHAGCYYVQEASSMFVEQAVKQCNFTEPVTALDLCAAPGGKSTHLCSLLPKGSLLVANEIHRGRAQILAENLTKWGKPEVMVTSNTPQQIGDSGLQFDLILVDAPCSGEGMFRKDDTAITEWSLENVEMCANRQKEILQSIWQALKPGGYIIYSTCTYNKKEDEENVKFIEEQLSATVISIPTESSWGIAPGYHFYPHRTKGEGFFLALLKKDEDEPISEARLPKQITSNIPAECKEWIQNSEDFAFQMVNDAIYARPKQVALQMQMVADRLYTLIKGICIATIKGKNTIPAHSLAMNCILNKEAFHSVELNKEDALRYLRCEALNIPNEPKGFVLFTYQGVTLGFGKNIGNRANNLYPQEWRIRKNL